MVDSSEDLLIRVIRQKLNDTKCRDHQIMRIPCKDLIEKHEKVTYDGQLVCMKSSASHTPGLTV